MKTPLQIYGLIGKTLTHSFSPDYFNTKFTKEGIENIVYRTFPLSQIEDFPALLENKPNIKGLNVTIPYKEAIIPYLDELSEDANKIGAVNTIAYLQDGKRKGYNTDVDGFQQVLEKVLQNYGHIQSALILGSGGAAKAVYWVLDKLGISHQTVSRKANVGQLTYHELDSATLQEHYLIVNTTPLGMFPDLNCAPDIPYRYLTSQHFLFDLIYNPEETLFMERGRAAGAGACNGLAMLKGQAEAAWKIWQREG